MSLYEKTQISYDGTGRHRNIKKWVKVFWCNFPEKRFGVVYALETITLHRKWSFLLSISSVNVTKSAEHIYWRTP